MRQIDQGRLLASIAATSQDCILSMDVDGTLLWASPATTDVLGWRPEELAGSDLAMVVTRLGDDVHREHLARALAGERVPPFVDEVVRRDGSAVKASVTLGPVEDVDGRVVGVTAIVRDVGDEQRQRRADARGTSCVLDPDLRLTHVAPSVAWLLGIPADHPRPDAWREAVHPDDAAEAGRVLLRVVAEPWRTERVVVRLRDGRGAWRPMEHLLTNRFDDADVRGLLVRLRDVSADVRRADALRLSESLQRTVVETAQDGLLALAPDGSTSFANDRVAEVLGRPLDEVYDVDVLGLLGLESWAAETGEVEVGYATPDGEERSLVVTRRPLHGPAAQVLGSLVSLSDVTEARQAESVLRRRALHDPLTGLPNRYLFLDRLETAAARHTRNVLVPGRGTAVLFLDLDGFKPINDGHGHAAGDEMLQEVASRLSQAVRGTDTVSRLGGDEFAIICEDVDEQDAVRVAEKILDQLRRPLVHAGAEHRVGVSIGVALAPPHSYDDLLARADGAMYGAKQRGGDGVVVARATEVSGTDEVAVGVR